MYTVYLYLQDRIPILDSSSSLDTAKERAEYWLKWWGFMRDTFEWKANRLTNGFISFVVEEAEV